LALAAERSRASKPSSPVLAERGLVRPGCTGYATYRIINFFDDRYSGIFAWASRKEMARHRKELGARKQVRVDLHQTALSIPAPASSAPRSFGWVLGRPAKIQNFRKQRLSKALHRFGGDVIAFEASENLDGRVHRHGGKFAQRLHVGAAFFAHPLGIMLIGRIGRNIRFRQRHGGHPCFCESVPQIVMPRVRYCDRGMNLG
jgi:hypothetical protein